MKLNFLPHLQMDLGSAVSSIFGGAASASPIGLGVGLLQTGFGVANAISSSNEAARLRGQRKAFETPEEVYKIIDAISSRAGQGYDALTLSYLNDSIDRNFTQSANTALKFGGDPNTVADLFDRRMQATMKVGAENHALNMENFNKWLGAVDVLGKNKEAEWSSSQDILKDDLQAVNQKKRDSLQNIGGGLNTLIGLDSAGKTMDLFNDDFLNKLAGALRNQTTGGVSGTSGAVAPR